MPIYEYSCQHCGTFEVSQRITDKPLKRCPTCKGKVAKLISSTSFQLKGSGWYVTDYAGNAKKPKEEGKPEASPAEAGKPESSPAKDASGAKESFPAGESAKSDSKAETTAA
jgi:putative FmdB family regulatory protein